MSENKEIKEAKEEYDKVLADEHERMLIRQREKYWLDYNSMKSASYEDGMEKEKKEIAKRMLSMGMNIFDIEKATGLSKEEIESL